MGLYHDHFLPRCLAYFMGAHRYAVHRRPALAQLAGRVLELGFGAGHNLTHYPDTVTEILALEPAAANRRLARRRLAASPIPVRWVGESAEEILLEDASVDAVASTFTLCSIEDLPRALVEVRRVLRPGGALHFLEHGRSPDPHVARWQDRWNAVSNAWCGCELDRRFDLLFEHAGFEVRDLSHPVLAGPKVGGYLYRGLATPAG